MRNMRERKSVVAKSVAATAMVARKSAPTLHCRSIPRADFRPEEMVSDRYRRVIPYSTDPVHRPPPSHSEAEAKQVRLYTRLTKDVIHDWATRHKPSRLSKEVSRD